MGRVITAVVFLLLVSWAPSTRACTCLGPSPEGAVRESEVIFAAYVVDGPASGKRGLHRLDVLTVWRGEVPETLIATDGVSSCDRRWEVGQTYLVYSRYADLENVGNQVCSRTGPIEDRYFDRYLLGEPAVVYDHAVETVTLDDFFERLAGNDGIEHTADFRYLGVEAPLVLPRLRRMALGHTPGNQRAAVRALGELGRAARPAYQDLDMIELGARRDPGLQAEALRSRVLISGEFEEVGHELLRDFDHPSSEVRRQAIELTSWWHLRYRREDKHEIARALRQKLSDDDPSVREAVLERLDEFDVSNETATRVRRMSRSDPSPDVRYAAREYLDHREMRSEMAPGARSLRARGFLIHGVLHSGRRAK